MPDKLRIEQTESIEPGESARLKIYASSKPDCVSIVIRGDELHSPIGVIRSTGIRLSSREATELKEWLEDWLDDV